MSVAIFDLDNTLLAGDSDHAWGEFLVRHGLADAEIHARHNDAFYRQYTEGKLDIDAYVKFTLGPVLHLSLSELDSLHKRFMEEFIMPMILPAARDLIESHKARGHQCLIMSATNSFITHPIAAELGVEHILSTDLETRDDHYTGRISGVPCFQRGKVTRFRSWLETQTMTPDISAAFFYSDSYNDVPLLETVGNPVAVDPDPRLAKLAQEKNWRVISLRAG